MGVKSIRRMAKLAAVAATIAAIREQLQRDDENRDWNGKVAGFVPYDFRVPTVAKVKERLWDPTGPMISPQVFGVGWTVNVGRLLEAAKQKDSTPPAA